MRLTLPGAAATTSGGWPNSLANAASASSLTVHLHRSQFRGLVVGIGVGGKYAGTEFTAGQILQPIRHAIRGIQLEVQVRLWIRAAVGRRLVDRHHIRKRPLPQAVVLEQHGL